MNAAPARDAPWDATALLQAAIGKAAGALCAMVNVDVDPGPVHAGASPVRGTPTAVWLGLGGGIDGSIVLLVPRPEAMAELLGVPEHLVESALAELGNIVGSHLLLGLEDATGTSLTITPPDVSRDPLVAAAWVEADAVGRAWVELECVSPVILVLVLRRSATE